MKRITLLAIAILMAIPAMAVTDKEMEEAKAIAAHAYLRYANDGSGYLDEIKPTSMGALESKLRAKEQENLKAFKSVKIPGDYATWDKDRLVQFWSITFFSSPNLSDKGKLAKSRVKARISAMNIGAAPAAAPADEPAAAPEAAPAVEETKPAAEAAPAAAETAAAAGEEILADQEAIAQDEEQSAPRHESNSTWIYVVVLILLIGAVVWLLMFASKMMKGSNDTPDDKQDANTVRRAAEQQPAAAPAQAQQPDKKSEALLRQYAATVEQLNADNDLLRAENNRIKNDKAQLEAQIVQLNAMIQDLRQRAAQAAQAHPAPVAPAPTSATPAAQQPASQHEHPAESGMPNVIYLGRANRQGLFVRADRRLAPNASIYRLDTSDGLVGTFHVVNRPEVVEFATSNPIDNLERGCIADDLLATAGVTSIITESAGTAIFEGGCWKVLRKSRIRYE